MSDVGMPTAEQITADLESVGQAAPAAPETPAPAAPTEGTEPVAPAAGTPAPATATPDPAATPTPLELTDTTLVRDPFDQKVKPWGEIKSERMLRADYSRKMHAVGEMRREAEAMRIKAEADARQAQIMAERAKLPELPEGDPFAVHQAALQKQLDAQAEAQNKLQEALQRDAQERMEQARQAELAASELSLAAKREKLGVEHQLDAAELDIVEREYWFRSRKGEPVSLDSVAKERADRIKAIEARAVAAFKEKHRVGSDAAGAPAPATGTATKVLTPGSPGFTEAVAEELGALFGR